MYQTAQMLGMAGLSMVPTHGEAASNSVKSSWAGSTLCAPVSARNSRAPLAKVSFAKHEPAHLKKLRLQFAEIRALRDGWDGPSSRQPDSAVVARAGRLLDKILEPLKSVPVPQIVPVADGGIQAEWYFAEHRFEAYFDTDGEFSAWSENRKTGVEMEEEGSDAVQMLIAWATLRQADLQQA